jgi:hypothetical protein
VLVGEPELAAERPAPLTRPAGIAPDRYHMYQRLD